jgi:hypothetical protein
MILVKDVVRIMSVSRILIRLVVDLGAGGDDIHILGSNESNDLVHENIERFETDFGRKDQRSLCAPIVRAMGWFRYYTIV